MPQLMSVLSVFCNPEHVIVDAQVLIKLYELKSVRAKMSSGQRFRIQVR